MGFWIFFSECPIFCECLSMYIYAKASRKECFLNKKFPQSCYIIKLHANSKLRKRLERIRRLNSILKCSWKSCVKVHQNAKIDFFFGDPETQSHNSKLTSRKICLANPHSTITFVRMNPIIRASIDPGSMSIQFHP